MDHVKWQAEVSNHGIHSSGFSSLHPLQTQGRQVAPFTFFYSHVTCIIAFFYATSETVNNLKMFGLFFLKLWLYIQLYIHHSLRMGKEFCQKDGIWILEIATAPNTTMFDLSWIHWSKGKTIEQVSHVHQSTSQTEWTACFSGYLSSLSIFLLGKWRNAIFISSIIGTRRL